METNQRLIKTWIQYLKNNQIVSLKSDPNSSQLKYRRPVTSEDVLKFLNSTSNFDEKTINSAIQAVLNTKSKNNTSSSKEYSATQDNTPKLDNISDIGSKSVDPDQKSLNHNKSLISHDPNSISDINYREVPRDRLEPLSLQHKNVKDKDAREPRPHFKLKTPATTDKKARVSYKGIKEGFVDNRGNELNEKDIEDIFNTLLSQQSINNHSSEQSPPDRKQNINKQQLSPEEQQLKKEENLRKIKKVIRDTMTPAQRMSFWRALNDNNINEEQIHSSEIKAALQGAATLRNNPGLLGKMPGLRKDKIDINDLQKAWKDAGYPDDTRDISAILSRQFGYSGAEIKKIFAKVFGASNNSKGYEEPVASPTIQNIVNYAKKNGIADDLKLFMKNEFGEELGLVKKNMFGRKIATEEVKQIFTSALQEDRSDRLKNIHNIEQIQLGRIKK